MNSIVLGGVLVNSVNQLNKLIEVPVKLNGKAVQFVLDSGAEVTVINEDAHRLIGKPKLDPFQEQAKYHDGHAHCLAEGKRPLNLDQDRMKGISMCAKKGL